MARSNTVKNLRASLATGVTWSEYQDGVFEFVYEGEGHGLVLARAGSGKTTTAVEALKYVPPGFDVLFLAFNKSIAKELERRVPPGVEARTTHSYGFKALRERYGRVRVEQDKLKRILFDIMGRDARNGGMMGAVRKLVGIAKDNLLTDPDEILEMAIYHGMKIRRPRAVLRNIQRYVLPALTASSEQTDVIDFADMCWLPLYNGISLPKYDFVFVDEAQDLNTTQAMMVQGALKRSGRLLAIGDDLQCQPAGTPVMVPGHLSCGGTTVNHVNIETLRPGSKVVTYARPGSALLLSATVTEVAVRSYSGNLIRVKAKGRSTLCTPNHKWLVRWHPRAEKTWAVYLMRKDWKYRVGYCQLLNNQHCFQLAQRARLEKADAAWVLGTFDSKIAAMAYEQIVSARFGLPQTMFLPSSTAERSHLTQEVVDGIYEVLGPQHMFEGASACLKAHGRLMEHPLYARNDRKRQGRGTLFETQACNLLSEVMKIPVTSTEFFNKNVTWHPLRVSREPFMGNVYSLNVEKHHKYVANGLVTCNSIYGFRGADSEAIPKIREQYNATVLPLPITYRVPKSGVAAVQHLVPDLQAFEHAIEGEVRNVVYKDIFPMLEDGHMVLCRTLAPLMDPCYELIKAGRTATIRGRDIGRYMIKMLEDVSESDGDLLEDVLDRLEDKVRVEVEKYIKKEKLDLAQRAMDNMEALWALSSRAETVGDLIETIEGIFSDETEGVIFSTAHRSKGLEADHVWIMRPDLMPHPLAKQPWQQQQELNLEYVARTRHKKTITDIDGPYPIPRKDMLAQMVEGDGEALNWARPGDDIDDDEDE